MNNDQTCNRQVTTTSAEENELPDYEGEFNKNGTSLLNEIEFIESPV